MSWETAWRWIGWLAVLSSYGLVPLLICWWLLRSRLYFKVSEHGIDSTLEDCAGSLKWADVRYVALLREGGDYECCFGLDQGGFTVDADTEFWVRSRLLAAMSAHLPGFSADSARKAIKARADMWRWERGAVGEAFLDLDSAGRRHLL